MQGCQVSLEKRVNMDPLALDFQVQLGLKVSYFLLTPFLLSVNASQTLTTFTLELGTSAEQNSHLTHLYRNRWNSRSFGITRRNRKTRKWWFTWSTWTTWTKGLSFPVYSSIHNQSWHRSSDICCSFLVFIVLVPVFPLSCSVLPKVFMDGSWRFLFCFLHAAFKWSYCYKIEDKIIICFLAKIDWETLYHIFLPVCYDCQSWVVSQCICFIF